MDELYCIIYYFIYLFVDFSLLAVLFALQVTNNPKTQNFKLAIIALLFAHVIMTSGSKNQKEQKEQKEPLGADKKIEPVDQSKQVPNEYDEVPNETDNVIPTEEVKIVRKNVSDGEFDRNFSVPPGSKLLAGPNPVVTNDTNKRLSNARTNFWSNILK